MSEKTSFSATTSSIHQGLTLLEASAGTGKTYSLVRLIARHLVEHEIPLDKVLTVTFTRAATAEIKSRLHELLNEILNELQHPQDVQQNDLVLKWVAEGEGRVQQAITAISMALASFDSVPIFTIDGFFQRLLKEYAFESKSLFSVELDTNEKAMIDTALRDYWRSHIYSMSADDYALFSSQIKFDDAKKFVSEVLRSGDAELDASYSSDFAAELLPYQENVISLKRLIIQHRDGINSFVSSPPAGISKRFTPFKGGTDVNFFNDLETFIAKPESPNGNLGRLTSISSEKLFSETAFNKGKWIDLSTHILAPVFKAIATTEDSYPKNLKSALLGEIYYFVAKRLDQIKEDRNVHGYSDVTQKLATLLTNGSAPAKSMTSSVRLTYQAALIDEFQDTSPQQSSVFLELFDHDDGFFHVIGDPKQSIYRFRGADVYAYIKASKLAKQKEHLDTNFRSSPQMIHAINQVFEMADDPFQVDNQIEFHPSKWPGQDDQTVPAQLAQPSLNLHRIDSSLKTVSDQEAAIQYAICQQTLELLKSPWESIAPNNNDHTGIIQPSDIAILVSSGREGEALANTLSALNVPVATQTQTSLLKSEEASDLLYILSAVINPSHTALLRSALLTVPLGSGSLLADDASFHQALEKFAHLQETWELHGLMPMMISLIDTFEVRPRILGLTQGLRRLTNFQHLAELLDSKAREEKFSPPNLLQWFEMAIQGTVIDTDADVLELRLSTDSPCLKILTQHSSKGLEFPIVFITPSCKAEFGKQKPDLSYHQEQTLQTIISSQESENDDPEIYASRVKESCADRARLAYVALTRAKFQCHYFHTPEKKKPEEHAVFQMLGEPTDEDWEKLKSNSHGTIAVHLIDTANKPSSLPPYLQTSSTETLELSFRDDQGAHLNQRKRTTSFTGITQPHHHYTTSQDLDEITEKRVIIEDTGFWARLQAGASLGSAFHEILEEIDFQQPRGIDRLIHQKLNSFQPWRTKPSDSDLAEIVISISECIAELLQHSLDDSVKLCQLTEQQRLTEPDFLLSASSYSLGHLADVLASSPPVGLPTGYIDQLRSLDESALTGFLTGFIDLIFEHEGRFHLLDWKTNRLTDYSHNGLASAMAEHHYYLQYHLYTLALDRLLQHRFGDDYDPETQLGNTYYVFLRGVDPATPGSGVFTDHIELDRLNALRNAFTPSLV